MLSNSLFLGMLVALALATVQVNGSGQHVIQVLYNGAVNMTCHPSDLDLHSLSPGDVTRMWILPDGEIVDAGTTGHARVDVLQNGEVLHVPKVDDEDFGLYYCLVHVYSESRYVVDIHGINVNGPYWGDLFELKYRDMLITGVIAAAVCSVVIGLFCFLYNKHQAREDAKAELEKAQARAAFISIPIKEKSGLQEPVTNYTNLAYEPDAEAGTDKSSPQTSVTQYTSVAYAQEANGKKSQAPEPPAQELQDVAAADTSDAAKPAADVDDTTSDVAKTKL